MFLRCPSFVLDMPCEARVEVLSTLRRPSKSACFFIILCWLINRREYDYEEHDWFSQSSSCLISCSSAFYHTKTGTTSLYLSAKGLLTQLYERFLVIRFYWSTATKETALLSCLHFHWNQCHASRMTIWSHLTLEIQGIQSLDIK